MCEDSVRAYGGGVGIWGVLMKSVVVQDSGYKYGNNWMVRVGSNAAGFLQQNCGSKWVGIKIMVPFGEPHAIESYA